MIQEFVASLRAQQPDAAEMAHLRAVVLFHPDGQELTAHRQLEAFQQRAVDGLRRYCALARPSQPGRAVSLLLRLPALRGMNAVALDHLFFPEIPMAGVLGTSEARIEELLPHILRGDADEIRE